MPVPVDDRVLVDYRTADDAGVYRLDEDRALVQTVDFFTPIVDDPATYGRIAAANALSDVYAMGGRPLTALAIAAFPATDFDPAAIRAVFEGGAAALREAGVALLGGHTVQDQEVKFGYAVTGVVHPERILRNGGAQPGDLLVLTKPLGTGVITTALKHARASTAVVEAAIRVMTGLNRRASEVLASAAPHVHACTDVTGFGLVGHASEMAAASDATLEITLDAVPLIEGALELAARNRPGGTATNAAHFGQGVVEHRPLDDDRRALVYDPQTSGGLLAAMAPHAADGLLALLREAGCEARVVGHVREAGGYAVGLG
jgi:selenide,water dikinase